MDIDHTESPQQSSSNNSNNRLAVVEWSDQRSILTQSTIPLFHLKGQTTTQAIAHIVNNQLKIEINHNLETNSEIDWSNSLFRPVGSETSKRRECKSSSDNQTITSIPHDFSVSMMSNNNRGKPYEKRLSGQFGFDPASVYKQKLTQLVGQTSSMASNVNVKILKSSVSKGEKRGCKRLGAGSKSFGFENKLKGHAIEQINQNKKLFHLVSNTDFFKVKDLLEQNLHDINSMDDKKRTCLHIASSRGHLEIVRLLLQYGANPNMRDCVSNLPIHLAIIASHVPVVTLLLDAGTDIHSLDLNGKTVLHLAGTRLRWLLNEDNSEKTSPKLKYEAIMIMDMIKLYLKRKKADASDLDMLADRLENVISFVEDISSLDDILSQFDTLNIQTTNRAQK